MYFTDRGIEELDERRGGEQVTLGWLAIRLQSFVNLHPDFGVAEPTVLMALGDAGWPGWEPGQASGHSASPAQGRPRPDETGLR